MIDEKHPSLLLHRVPVEPKPDKSVEEAEKRFTLLVEKRLTRLAERAAENVELVEFARQLAAAKIIREQEDRFTSIVDRLDILVKNAELEGEVLTLLKERLTSTKQEG